MLSASWLCDSGNNFGTHDTGEIYTFFAWYVYAVTWVEKVQCTHMTSNLSNWATV